MFAFSRLNNCLLNTKSWRKKLYVLFCGSIAFMMVAPTTLSNIFLYSVDGIVLSYGILKLKTTDADKQKNQGIPYCISIVLTVLVCRLLFRAFTKSWTVSSTVARVASICQISTAAFLSIVGVLLLLGIFAGLFILVFSLVFQVTICLKTTPVKTGLFVLAILAASLQLQFSCLPSFIGFFQVNKFFVFINTLAVGLWFCLSYCIFKKLGIAIIVASASTTLWSITNYYTIMYHGSPLFFSEFHNLPTAVNVISQYSFKYDQNIIILLLMSLVQFICAVIVVRIDKRKTIIQNRFGTLMLCLGLAVFVLLVYTNTDYKPKTTMTGSWTYGVKDYGYVCCLFEDIDRRINPIVKPEGYNTELILKEKLDAVSYTTTDLKPDIILVLNESFYDLRVFTDIETDNDYLSDYYGIEEAHYGYVVQPGYCGGTNNTEFELLTSNSMALLPISAPFTYLDFSKDKNSFAQYLKEQGYSTVAMHCGGKSNYSRNRVYPLIGFDECLLGSEPFTFSKYGNRPWMDEDNYRDLISYYNQMSDAPRFVYLLTIQNHGGWEQNDSSYDVVHSLTDYNGQTEIVNEYLSCIKYSGEAFSGLIDKLRTNDRPVLVFMMGDHAPSFLPSIVPNDKTTESETRLAGQMVPFAVWANFSFDWYKEDSVLTATDVVSLIKRWSGLPLTSYDQIILKMHEVAPCRLPSGEYWTADHQMSNYKSDIEALPSTVIQQYLYMEYNLLKGGKAFRSDWFK